MLYVIIEEVKLLWVFIGFFGGLNFCVMDLRYMLINVIYK